MTWSILAKDPATGAIGLAVATCAFAVGARVPYGCGQVGAIATQSFVNPFIGIDGLRLLQEGRSAREAIELPLLGDPGGQPAGPRHRPRRPRLRLHRRILRALVRVGRGAGRVGRW